MFSGCISFQTKGPSDSFPVNREKKPLISYQIDLAKVYFVYSHILSLLENSTMFLRKACLHNISITNTVFKTQQLCFENIPVFC